MTKATGYMARKRERHERWLAAYLEGGTFQRIAAAEGAAWSAVAAAVYKELARRGQRVEYRRVFVPVPVAAVDAAPRETRARHRDPKETAEKTAKGGSKARHERWLRIYLEGGTLPQIAAAEGVTHQAVQQAVHKELARRGQRVEYRRVFVPVPPPPPRETRARRRAPKEMAEETPKPRGHPRGWTREQTQARWGRWRELYEGGRTPHQIAREEGVTRPAVTHAIRRQFVIGDNPRPRRTAQLQLAG